MHFKGRTVARIAVGNWEMGLEWVPLVPNKNQFWSQEWQAEGGGAKRRSGWPWIMRSSNNKRTFFFQRQQITNKNGINFNCSGFYKLQWLLPAKTGLLTGHQNWLPDVSQYASVPTQINLSYSIGWLQQGNMSVSIPTVLFVKTQCKNILGH